jgi:hypothetical protein
MKEKDIKYTQALREIKEEWAAKAVKTDNPREYYMGYNETPTSLEKP